MTEVPPWEPVATRKKYEQLADHLAARISSGEFRPGQRLPPELAFADEYQVAYHTVRSAMRVLRDRGLIVTIHGGGTYVAPPEP
jgi:GntR family transcriptional regulator